MINLIYSKQQFSEKPIDKRVIIGLQNPNNYVFAQVETIEELADLIGNGRAWRAGLYEEGTDSFKKAKVKSAQILALDFDSCPQEPQVIIEYAEDIGIRPSVWYYSYSQGKKPGNNFRILWILEEPIKHNQYETIYKNLLEQFADYGPDISTKDASRLWFGTKSGVNIINETPMTKGAIGWLGVCEKVKQGQPVEKAKKAVKALESDYFTDEADLEPFYITASVKWWDELRVVCRLWDKWIEGKYLNYNERLTLFTNLKYLRYSDNNISVISKVLEYYEQYKEVYENHTCNEAQIRSMFKNTTLHAIGIVKVIDSPEPITVKEYLARGEHKVISTVKTIQLEELDAMLNEQMPQMLSESGLAYIQAQTACGKTERVIKWLLEQDLTQRKIIYSVPRYSNITEFRDRFIAAYAAKFGSNPIRNGAIKIIPKGKYTQADLLRMELGLPPQMKQTERIKAITEMRDYNIKGLFVCSHVCISHLQDCIADCIIIDENIEETLKDEVLIDGVGLTGLISCVQPQYRDKINELEVYLEFEEVGREFSIAILRKALADGFNWDKYIASSEPVSGLGKIQRFVNETPKTTIKRKKSGARIVEAKAIVITTKSPLITNAIKSKTPIKFLSATPKSELLKYMYELTDNDIEIKVFPQAKNRGQIIQYCGKTGARGNGEERIEDLIKYVKSKITDEIREKAIVISFKDSADKWKAAGFNIMYIEDENGEKVPIHLANNAGLDFLKGKTIIVAGKFDYPTEYYERKFYELHPNSTEKPVKGNVKVKNANRIFNIWGYKDKELNKIQMENIDLFLTQACGRARALREQNATVYLFANFIIADADIVYDK